MEEWSSLCRCCLSTGTQTSLLYDDVRSKFFETTSIEVNENDGLPQGLCDDCLSVMNSAHQFKRQCLRIDSELKIQLTEVTTLTQTDMETESESANEIIPETQKAVAKKVSLPPNVLVKSEPVESDDDCYYVLVIDDEKDDISAKVKKEPKDLNPAIGEVEFEKSVDSFFVRNSVEKPNEMDSDKMEIEVMPDAGIGHYNFAEDDTNDSENNTQLELRTGMNLSEAGALLSNSNGNIIKILTSNGTTENLLFRGDKGDEIVTYIMDDQMDGETDDLSQDEVIVCEGDESQFQIVNYDGSELVIEYAEDGQITSTVVRKSNGKFICCDEEFTDLIELENHQSTQHTDQENQMCTLCGKGFESNEILTGHMLLHTNSGANIQCPYCEQKVKRNTITQHIKYNHNNIKPRCSICHKTFANPNNLKRHMTIHSGVRQYECEVCSKRFHQKITLQTHKLTHASAGPVCEPCDIKFATTADLLAHQEQHECEESDPLEKNNYQCHMCSKRFTMESALRCHMQNVHDEKPLELLCSECGEVLPSRKALTQHIAQHRPDSKSKMGLKRFECSICGKNCTSQAMLIMHERVHTNERPFQCPLCALRFKTKTHLRTHQLTHTREKRFGCSVCMKFFALKGNLVVHLRTHTGERPYICSICNEAFIDSKYLKKHKEKKHFISNVPWNQY